jgi:hypothetical protein
MVPGEIAVYELDFSLEMEIGGLRRLRVGILLHARVWRGVMVQG